MDYRVASNIRGKSLSSLMTDRITEGGSIGSSIKGAISDKLKAKGTGIKEKFDPMNIARAMTGGGKLAPAILGRMTGRSQSDINYFAGNKNKASSYTQMPQMTTPPGGGLGGSAVEVLNKMLSFMQKNREEDVKYKETEMSFQEENQSEEERRHTKFLKVLKDFTSVKTTTLVDKKETGGGGGMFDGIMEILKGMFDKFMEPFKFLWDNKDKFLGILRWMSGPLGLALLGTGAIMWLGEQLRDYFRENVEDMKIIGPTEAANLLLNGNQKDIDKFPGGEKALRDIIETGPKRATEILARGDKAEILAAGGADKLREIEKDIIAQPAKRDAFKEMSPSIAPRAIYAGNGTAKKSKEDFWDKNFGPYYDPKTGQRLDLLNSSTADAGRGSAESAATGPRRLDLPAATTTPVPETPATSAVVGKIQENNDLTMNALATSGGSSSGPSVSVSNTSSSEPDKIVTSTATTRDDTPILNRVFDRVRGGV